MLRIPSVDPTKLLADIKAAISANTIRTWKVDAEGDFSHTDNQLSGKGFYFRPAIDAGALRFRTLFMSTVTDKTERRFGYAYLHGHMTAMIITHYADRVTAGKVIEATPNPSSGEDSSI